MIIALTGTYLHINHTLGLHKCTCANIKVGMAAKLQRKELALNVQQTNEGSNI